MTAVVHIAGEVITVSGRHMRQRCSWCGAVLIDYDLTMIAVPVGQDPTPPTWPVGDQVRIDGNVSTIEPGHTLPADSCAKLDPAATV